MSLVTPLTQQHPSQKGSPLFIHRLALGFLEYKKEGNVHLNVEWPACAEDQVASGSVMTTSPMDKVTMGDASSSGSSLEDYLQWLKTQSNNSQIGESIASGEALLLRWEHWLEAADELHRHGSNLRPYFDFWVENMSRSEPSPKAGQANLGPETTSSSMPPRNKIKPNNASSKKWQPAGGWQKVLEAVAAASPVGGMSAPVSLSSSPLTLYHLGGVGLGYQMYGSVSGSRMPHVLTSQEKKEPTTTSHAMGQGFKTDILLGLASRPEKPQHTHRRVNSESQLFSLHDPSKLRNSTIRPDEGGHDDDDEGDYPAGLSEDGDDAYFVDGVISGCSDTEDDEPGRSDADAQLRMYCEDMGDIDLFTDCCSASADAPSLPRVHLWRQRTASTSTSVASDSVSAAEPSDHDAAAASGNFFHWLDHGAGRGIDLAAEGVSRAKLESERVRYLTPEELPQYEVVVDRGSGLLKYRQSGQLLHTLSQPDDAKESPKWIWVVGPSKNLYVHAKTRGTLASFHHSSFVRGSVVLAAGNMMVDQGRLVALTADSGHYWPKPGHFRWFFDRLQQQGADLSSLEGLDFSTKH